MAAETIALLTDSQNPRLIDGEKLLPGAFAHAGIETMAAPWDRENDWKKSSAIIIRQAWNYIRNRHAFLSFLEKRREDGIQVWNPLNTVAWNTDKRYLLELETRGVPIIPTRLYSPKGDEHLGEILEQNGWQEAVVKPVVGSDSRGIQKFSIDTARDIEQALHGDLPWIVQQFCPQIYADGEYSLVFFDRRYSHAAVKTPKQGDFRTQPNYGGKEVGTVVSSGIIHQAEKVLDTVEGPLLYARVDGMVLDGKFHLMELELTEPYLFFEWDKHAPERFVQSYLKLSREQS